MTTPRTPVQRSSSNRQMLSPAMAHGDDDIEPQATPLSDLVTPDTERERSRMLLAQFYGSMMSDQDGEFASSSAATPVNNKQVFDTSDLDSSHFNPDDFLKKTITNKSVDELLVQEDSLKKQTKKLDTSLQMLVYENYNKFITATDTIKKMKHHVEGMEDEMKSLLQNMDKITGCSETINSNLQNKRDKIERLSSVNRTLKKMQFLLELPTRLNECIEMKKYNVAVKYFSIANKIFTKNANLSGFKNIEKESNDVIQKMKDTIEKDVMNITDDNDPRVQDYLKILIDLEVPIDRVRDAYLKIRADYLKNQMEKVMQETENSRYTTTNDRVKSLNTCFLKAIQTYYYTYQMTFLTNDPKIRKQTTAEQLSKDFVEWTKQLFISYFEHIRILLLKSQTTNEDLKAALKSFCNESVAYINEIPNNKLQDRVYNLVGDTVMTFLIKQMDTVKQNTEQNLQKLAETPETTKPHQLTKIIEETIQNLKKDLELGLNNYQQFILAEEEVASPLAWVMQFKDKIFKNWIKSMCVEFIDSLLLTCKDFGTPHSRVAILTPEQFKVRKVTSVGALLLAKLCTKLPLRDFKQLLREKFTALDTNARSKNRDIDEDDTLFNIENMELRIKECSSHLIVYYVEIQARNVSKVIRTGMETHNWLETDVPRDVRHVIRVTVTDLISIRNQLIEMFPPSQIHDIDPEKSDSGRSGRSTRSAGESSFTYGAFNSESSSMKYSQSSEVVKDVMRIFNKKLANFTIKMPRYFQRAGDSSFSGNEILTEIVKIVVKTLEECVRSVTFGKNGFQQLQVDIAFMQQKSVNLIEDKSFLPSLMQEVMASCAERCISATPLESTIVQSIISKYMTEDSSDSISSKQ
ncbi:hypothetical protein C9374_009706 [Naegleria lovaniensis]|uniref:Vacuolar protein sorting-associated protein 51 homolog n=1 Tax=Naegleria lovaniensis TaxID=51637 RepID=A0AA88KRZ1_NAELO|nr:uncharacterized protein C9374_009706 [Naegleria lovaniensis]KAG2393129.1 hypothetical protein C9374_009706 [Naegleria lovaniensis]